MLVTVETQGIPKIKYDTDTGMFYATAFVVVDGITETLDFVAVKHE